MTVERKVPPKKPSIIDAIKSGMAKVDSIMISRMPKDFPRPRPKPKRAP